MSLGITPNFEYIAAHIDDYIKNENLFNLFEIGELKTIMKQTNLTSNQYISLLQQSIIMLAILKL